MSEIKFNITHFIHKTILFLLCLTLLFNIQEYIKSFNVVDLNIGPLVFYKIGKDVGFVLIILLSILSILKQKRIPIVFTFFFFLIIIAVLLSLNVNDMMYSLVGLRWLLPFFLIFAVYPFVDEKLIYQITKILYILLIIHVFSQLLQLVFMPPKFGVTFLGLSARDTGIFVYPSPSGLFANTCYVFFTNIKKYKYSTLLVIISLLLTMSSSGTFLFLLLFFINKYYNSRYFKLICMSIPFLGYITFQNLDLLTGRNEGDTMSSGTSRVEIFTDQFSSMGLISDKFGMATNTAYAMKLENAFIADSTYTSILANLGVGCFIIFIFFLIFILLYVLVKKRKDILLFFILVTFGSISQITVEFFPINMLFPILISYYLKRETLLINESA